jgi:flagellin
MDEMTTMYQRIRTLAIQSANGTNSQDDRDALQREVTQLCAEIDRITKDTTFAGEKILTGTKSTNNDLGDADVVDNYSRASAQVEFQVGGSADQTISILLGNGTDELGYSVADVAKSIGATKDVAITADATSYLKTDDTGVSTGLVFNISSAQASQNVLGVIDQFITRVDTKRAELGAVQNRLESTIRNQSNVAENVSDARSRIRDTDFAVETANMAQTSIIQLASMSILAQANQRSQLALGLLG